jgi:hypothetical protein
MNIDDPKANEEEEVQVIDHGPPEVKPLDEPETKQLLDVAAPAQPQQQPSQEQAFPDAPFPPAQPLETPQQAFPDSPFPPAQPQQQPSQENSLGETVIQPPNQQESMPEQPPRNSINALAAQRLAQWSNGPKSQPTSQLDRIASAPSLSQEPSSMGVFTDPGEEDYVPKKDNRLKYLITLVVFIVVIAGAGIGFLVYKQRNTVGIKNFTLSNDGKTYNFNYYSDAIAGVNPYNNKNQLSGHLKSPYIVLFYKSTKDKSCEQIGPTYKIVGQVKFNGNSINICNVNETDVAVFEYNNYWSSFAFYSVDVKQPIDNSMLNTIFSSLKIN